MLTPEEIDEAARQLHEAEQACRQIPALTQSYPDMDLDDAYAVQKRWIDRKIAAGRSVVGYKIGLTSRAMQMAMKIDTPDYGVLLDDMMFANRSRIAAGDFTDPRLEVEFAFVLKRPLFGADVSLDEVMAATDYVVPALELIAARSYRVDPDNGYTRTVCDTIADNAANAGVITGDLQVNPEDVDLRWAGALFYLNGEIEETGLGAAVMDHPGHGIRWVCKRFAPHGIGLEPGQLILSGSFTRPVIVQAGDHVRVDYGPLGDITLDFV
ncbi:MAG: 2-oxo-hept-4-ene-1,7-dioate hydratase [Gammaproteobacteria bacterium]|jgi:2-oxo-hept-3-ene-1,7-dioate hydratase